MIKDIDDLKRYTDAVAQRFSIIEDEVRMVSPGCEPNELKRLKDELPNIPASYVEVVSALRLVGISIGQFALWPRPFGNGLVDAVITANSDSSNPHLKIYQAHGLIEVARLEANPVCVADSKQSGRSGQVFLVNVAAGPDPSIVFLANNFKDFLLQAANVHSVSLEYENEPSAGLDKLRACLSAFGLTDSDQSFWLRLAEEMF
jgi:hypothetical protein